MKRTVSFLVFVALLVLAGCSNSGAVAATVNGHDISAERRRPAARTASASRRCSASSSSQQGVDLQADGHGADELRGAVVGVVGPDRGDRAVRGQEATSTASDQEVAQARQQFTGQRVSERRRLQAAAEVAAAPARADTTALQLAVRSTLKPSRERRRSSPARTGSSLSRLREQAADRPHPRADGRRGPAGGRPHHRAARASPTVASRGLDRPGSSAQGGLLSARATSQWSQIDPDVPRPRPRRCPAGGSRHRCRRSSGST